MGGVLRGVGRRAGGCDDGTFVYPAVYPAHHPNAGNAHPHAGRPDIDLAARALTVEWCRRLKLGLIKPVPHGSVHKVEEYSSSDSTGDGSDDDVSDTDEPETSNHIFEISHNKKPMKPTRKITIYDVCGICGGRGHYGTVNGKKCLTLLLGNKIPIDELKQTKYPNNIRFPNFRSNEGSSSRHNASIVRNHSRPKSPGW